MITSYFNTIKETGKELVVSKAKAYSQEESIMDIFFDRSVIHMTPSDVWHIYCQEFKDVPLTSIRRAITSLTHRYQLVKTDRMREGIYGKLEHCWRLAKAEDKQIPLM
tara:strand:+ start:96 stop:419 length:324 start_codon:yes stop_codon:yes gene_type:complete